MVLYLFFILFGASSNRMGLVFEWVLYFTVRHLDTKFVGSMLLLLLESSEELISKRLRNLTFKSETTDYITINFYLFSIIKLPCSDPVTVLGLIIECVLCFSIRPFGASYNKCVLYSKASYNSENTVFFHFCKKIPMNQLQFCNNFDWYRKNLF